jgi:hypothetical protein
LRTSFTGLVLVCGGPTQRRDAHGSLKYLEIPPHQGLVQRTLRTAASMTHRRGPWPLKSTPVRAQRGYVVPVLEDSFLLRSGGSEYHYRLDALGLVYALTDGNESVRNDCLHQAFGSASCPSTEYLAQPYRFTATKRDGGKRPACDGSLRGLEFTAWRNRRQPISRSAAADELESRQARGGHRRNMWGQVGYPPGGRPVGPRRGET